MSRPCPTCGSDVDENATVCPVCGLEIEPVTTGFHSAGIYYIRIFAIISLFLGAIGIVTTITGTGTSELSSLFNTEGGTSSPPNLASAAFLYFLILTVTTMVVSLLSYIFLFLGYDRLAGTSGHFESPRTGSILLIVGIVMTVIPALVIIAMAPNLLRDPNTITFSGAELAALVLALLVLLIGLIMILVGVILAMILGMHRLSTGFRVVMFDAAMIFYIFAFFFSPLTIVAAILALLGCEEVIKKTRSTPM